MARSRKTATEIQERWSKPEHALLMAAVAKYFCEGIPPSKIRENIEKDFGWRMTREAPWELLGRAAAAGRLQYIAPWQEYLAERIQRKYGHLKRVRVVNTSVMDDVATEGAAILLDLVRDRTKALRAAAEGSKSTKKKHLQSKPQHEQADNNQSAPVTVHMGLAGGLHMRRVAQIFARLIAREPAEKMPNMIQLQSLIGDNPDSPNTNPNAFFLDFDQILTSVKFRFQCLTGPAIIESNDYDSIKDERIIRKAFILKENIHIAVLGLDSWEDEHGALRKMLKEESPKDIGRLERKGCVGDILWQPLGVDGPITAKTEVRALTLFKDTKEMSNCIDRGVDILLVAGPCPLCHKLKQVPLKVVLNIKPPLITHLVVDSQSVDEIAPQLGYE
jgi:DNA-binding transcriptional regulator LsrR (DeoR family)